MDKKCKSYKLWQSFMGGHLPKYRILEKSESTSMKCMKWLSSQTVVSLLNPIRTVHAAEAEVNTELTTIEKLGTRHSTRPNIIITDEDVEKYLKIETGKDRLNELFTVRFVLLQILDFNMDVYMVLRHKLLS